MGRCALLLILLCLLGLFSVSSAQQSEALKKMPLCGQTCLLQTFVAKVCSPADKKCICTNEQFQASVALCVTQNCSMPEALVIQNISSTNCGVPVRDHGPGYITLSVVMIVLAGLTVVTRIAFKVIDGHGLGLDDWSIIATLIVATACTTVIIAGAIKNGLGKDIWTLRPNEITSMLKYFYIMASLYFMELLLLKLSLLFFYIRIFPSKDIRRLLWGTVAFTTLWGIIFVALAIFQCRPISFFWNKWDGSHKGTCLDINSVTAANAGISIVLDFWSLAIPLWGLWGLKMHWKKKIGVVIMFCVGTFITIVSIVRLQAVVHFSSTHNVSWEFFYPAMWSTIEVGVGIMCTCLPTLRLLFVKLFPVLGGSTARSQQYQDYYRSDNELGDVSKDRSRRNGVILSHAVVHSPTTPHHGADGGINVRTSFAVKHFSRDYDEASLVSHDEVVAEKKTARPSQAF